MEYMPGGDLERYLRSRRVEPHRPWVPPTRQIFRWASGVARALSYLNGLSPPMVHGNLKPSNLLLCSSLEIKVSTSGVLSPVVHRALPGDPNLEKCLYSAPEVMTGSVLHATVQADAAPEATSVHVHRLPAVGRQGQRRRPCTQGAPLAGFCEGLRTSLAGSYIEGCEARAPAPRDHRRGLECLPSAPAASFGVAAATRVGRGF
ncbi:unnamed protein product [Polarella glacialis]|uniref:Protein kinase domain-containing protein n=1 Tax=Polarella glacialis TaxID=89957 RepID=A0A813FUU5_POLGL|nr:unnamed protein product [Polarella glacialis]